MARSGGNSNFSFNYNLDPNSITFSMFTSEELKKLCVVKIVSPLTFDTMGHPLPGGLYDRAMGPLGSETLPCGTCFKTVINCPGHFGYIELPLPVVNPLFHKILGTIVKLSCSKCYRMQISTFAKPLISIYIHLLNCGIITEAREIENILYEIISENDKTLEDAQLKRIKQIQKMSKSIGTVGSNQNILNKTTESLRNQVLHDLLKTISSKSCMHCKENMDNIHFYRRKIIINEKINVVEMEQFQKANNIKIMTAQESKNYMRKLWVNESELLLELMPVLKNVNCEFPTDIMYFETLPVPPPICRPVNFVNKQIVEHPQTQIYKSILQESMVAKTIIHVVQGKSVDLLPTESKTVFQLANGETPTEKLHNIWQQLQTNVDTIMDSDLSSVKLDSQGLKQIIEKKEGIIRMHMMGKRVNFSGRSVITPDPNLNIDEIGVPEAFAKHLTYPITVTPWNVEEVRKIILNGPNKHPGANRVEFGDGTMYMLGNRKTQESILKRLLTPIKGEQEGFKSLTTVYRHLINGDILLLNRQPTLHRPSIMAHKARILKNEKTIRLHYANCKAYNADFDGDEMNLHFPQNELARSEAYNLVNVSNQYLVPKDGTPLSGLIQDHMVSGVRLSVRGKFFKKHDYHQLVYQALAHKPGKIILLPPAILKPETLWSGKQILSTIIINIIPRNKTLLNLVSTAKINSKAWNNYRPREWMAGGTPFKNPNDMTEAEVIIREGQLLCGILDKKHYGSTPYGLVHCLYELYGGQYAIKFLTSLARLFTCFLQQEGFTLGVHDILVQKKADKKRSKIIEACRKVGHFAAAKAVDVDPSIPEAELFKKLEKAHATNPKFRTIIDREYKQTLDSFTNDINKVCLPAGLICKFPQNNLQLMVQSGAKGSTVNTMQISCLLGQIELEGKRPPVMISGKSLPSFIPFDVQPRAGGFIDGRFMTGILPQEFFFHCMAGREGLIDTAVKTSRSGYLQRCLVKHLEGLKVNYDLTVRDSDQSVVQFLYGEDGFDISKVQFLKSKQINFLFDNSKALVDQSILSQLKNCDDYSEVKKHIKKLKHWTKKNGDPLKQQRNSPFMKFSQNVQSKIDGSKKIIDPKSGRSEKSNIIIDMWRNATEDIKNSFIKECKRCPDPTNSDYQPDHYYGSLTDHLESLLNQHNDKIEKDEILSDSFKLKAMQSLVAPGEPVGLLAAQSIGEPSTQMTLNTFHFAGRGEMNVTLGIPRLREILMMASENIKTPSMEIPFQNLPDIEEKAEKFRRSLSRVTVANVLEKVDVTVKLKASIRQYDYKLKFHFLPKNLYENEYRVKPKKIINHMNPKFLDQFFAFINKCSKMSKSATVVSEFLDKVQNRKKKNQDNDEETENVNEENPDNYESSDEEPEDAEEDAKIGSKFKSKMNAMEPDADDVENNKDWSDSENSDNEREKSEENNENEGVNTSFNESTQKYYYDEVNYLWCVMIFSLPLKMKNMDLTAIIKTVAEKSVISQVVNIKRAITYKKDNKDLMLRTDGINLSAMFKNYKILDVNRVYSNDIHQIAKTYGIEAARRVIVKEVKDVFNVYGITVDPRHLLLIADYMTYNGTFEPLSRRGMECNSSPLQQISFESSLKFLRDASIGGKTDVLNSPSSCLMLGKPCTTGTGCFNLLQKIG